MDIAEWTTPGNPGTNPMAFHAIVDKSEDVIT
jgi:hypothetical protein